MSVLPKVSLSGRVVLVTGGTQGIGEGCALAAAEAGAAGVCITGRNAARGERPNGRRAEWREATRRRRAGV